MKSFLLLVALLFLVQCLLLARPTAAVVSLEAACHNATTNATDYDFCMKTLQQAFPEQKDVGIRDIGLTVTNLTLINYTRNVDLLNSLVRGRGNRKDDDSDLGSLRNCILFYETGINELKVAIDKIRWDDYRCIETDYVRADVGPVCEAQWKYSGKPSPIFQENSGSTQLSRIASRFGAMVKAYISGNSTKS